MTEFSRPGKALAWLVLALLVGMAARRHLLICGFPYEMLPSEAGLAQSARGMAAGLDPWQANQAPVFFNAYSWLTPSLAGGWMRAVPGADALSTLRWISFLALLFTAGLIYRHLRRQGAEPLESAAAALCFDLGMLFFEGASAKPDAVAVALYVAALLAAFSKTRPAAAASGILAAVAFYAKPYALLAAPLVFLLWILRRERRGLMEAVAAFTATSLLLAASVLMLWPNYYLGSLFLHGHALRFSWSYFGVQLKALAQFQLPLVLALLGGFIALRWNFVGSRSVPALRPWAWVTAAVLLALALGPGRVEAAFLIYFVQLFMAPLLIFAVLAALRRGWPPSLRAAVLLLNAGFALWMGGGLFPADARAAEKDWPRAEALVAQAPYGFYPPIMSSLLARRGAFISDTDHSHVLRFSRLHSKPTVLAEAGAEHFRKLGAELAAGRFEVAVCGAYWPCPEAVMTGYRRQGELCLGSPIQAPTCFGVYFPTSSTESKEKE